ncbi:MAG TPA: FKBP-type peptidyl-prolyl cis-trans isomerase [Nitrospiria bacterium]
MLLRIVFFMSVLIFSSQAFGEDQKNLKSAREKASYSIGLNIGSDMRSQPVELDLDALTLGIRDSFSGKESRLSEDERRDAMNQLQQEAMAKAKEQAEKNQKEGEKFLAENKKKKGVVTLASGLQYKVIKKGKGEKPKLTDQVTTNYKGTLIDGTEFDSSYGRGEPATFPVNGVIPGWTEALQLMEVGSKWELYVPANLAYGERGAGQKIGPHSTLVFDVELLSIKN